MLVRLKGRGPLHRSVYEALREKILLGELASGSALPGTRTLARDLGVSRIVTLAAFEQLAAEGYIDAVVGSGSRVAAQLPSLPAPPKRARAALAVADGEISPYARRARQLAPHVAQQKEAQRSEKLIDFAYTATQPEARTVTLWRQAVTRAAARLQVGYPDPAGLPALRRLLVEYLREERGVVAGADDVVIVGGSQQAIDLAARVVCEERSTIGIEDPHYQGTRQALVAAGARVVACPVGEDGLDIERHDKRLGGARAVVVTPSHQFPTGAIMSVARRIALLHWAEANRAWIIEDDYDCEFRYGVGAIPALQGLDTNGRVIYVGTFARMLFPSLRLGYIVVPPSLRETFRAVKWLADRGSPPLEQQAIASLLESGAYESMRRRSVRRLSEKRDRMVAAVQEHFPVHDVAIGGASSGTHVFLTLRRFAATDTADLVARAEEKGVRVYSALPYYKRAPRHAVLILGYTSVGVDEIARGVERFAFVLKREQSRRFPEANIEA